MPFRLESDINEYRFLVYASNRSLNDFILLWPLFEAFSVEICKFAALLLGIQIIMITVVCSVEPFDINH